MSCLFFILSDLKIFNIYVNGSADFEKYNIYGNVSAPLRSLPPAHALENGF